MSTRFIDVPGDNPEMRDTHGPFRFALGHESLYPGLKRKCICLRSSSLTVAGKLFRS